MKLINAETGELEDFMANPPPYAILSHTWGIGEVTYQDMALSSRALKQGYTKIEKTCQIALGKGLGYAWVDTCCIDKSSSAELTESINSMFEWYQKAKVCFAFLEDLEPAGECFNSCKWFTRGWTLQELLAPAEIEFYDASWTFRGTRRAMVDLLSQLTRIPKQVLEGQRELEDCSVAAKMSWASGRETTRTEDIAYSLLGIFDVHMPTIYGEGENAFRRLQEEIIKRRNDLTIFAWKPIDFDRDTAPQTQGLFAQSPSVFSSSSTTQPFSDDFSTTFTVTNRGLWVSGDAPIRLVSLAPEDPLRGTWRYALFLGRDANSLEECAMFLLKGGPKIFYRDGRFPLVGIDHKYYRPMKELDVPDYFILINPVAEPDRLFSTYRDMAVHVPYNQNFILHDSVPSDLWDQANYVFLKPKPYRWAGYDMVLAMLFTAQIGSSSLQLVVLSVNDMVTRGQKCIIVPPDANDSYICSLFNARHRNSSVYLDDLWEHCPDAHTWGNIIELSETNNIYRISASLVKAPSEYGMSITPLNLVFRVTTRRHLQYTASASTVTGLYAKPTFR